MKKTICLVTALLVCFSLALPVFAAEDEFVPSISYKDGPEVVTASLDGEDVEACLVVTSIEEAEDKSTDIMQEERDSLLDIYEDLVDGTMPMPVGEEYVIRDLVDVSFEYEDCRNQEDHESKADKLAEEGTTLTVTFDLGVDEDTEVVVMTYIDGQWQPVVSVVNNDDGTVTCEFEDLCPVLFAVLDELYEPVPGTGDLVGQSLILWVGLMAVSAAALVAVVVGYRRKNG